MHRRTLAAQHAVTLALILMIAHQRADRGQRIVLKEHAPRFIQLAVKHQLNDMGNRRMNRAAALTHGVFAVETAAGLLQNMNGHVFIPSNKDSFAISYLYYTAFARRNKDEIPVI